MGSSQYVLRGWVREPPGTDETLTFGGSLVTWLYERSGCMDWYTSGLCILLHCRFISKWDKRPSWNAELWCLLAEVLRDEWTPRCDFLWDAPKGKTGRWVDRQMENQKVCNRNITTCWWYSLDGGFTDIHYKFFQYLTYFVIKCWGECRSMLFRWMDLNMRRNSQEVRVIISGGQKERWFRPDASHESSLHIIWFLKCVYRLLWLKSNFKMTREAYIYWVF